MANWAAGTRQPLCEGQEGRGSLGNLQGGLGKTGKRSKGREGRACPEWGAEVGAPVQRQVWSVGVPWVFAPLAPGLGALAHHGALLPSPGKQKDTRQRGVGSQAAAEAGSQPECGWSIPRKYGEDGTVLAAGGCGPPRFHGLFLHMQTLNSTGRRARVKPPRPPVSSLTHP